MSKDKKRREDDYASAKDYFEKSNQGGSGGFTALNLPPEVTLYKWKKGRNLLDVFSFRAKEGNPVAKKGQKHWERTFNVHNIPTSDGRTSKFVCLQEFKEKCPICIELGKERRKGDMDEESIKKMEPKRRRLMVVRDLLDKEAPRFQALETAHWKSFGEKLQDYLEAQDDSSPVLDFYKLSCGLSMEVMCKKDSYLGHDFNAPTIINFLPRKKQYKEEMVEKIPSADDFLKKMSFKALLDVYRQGDEEAGDKEDEDEDNEDEDEEPKSKKKKKKVDAFTDDDDDDDQPKKKKRKRDEEDDDEQDDESEEEEDGDDEEGESEDEDEDEEGESGDDNDDSDGDDDAEDDSEEENDDDGEDSEDDDEYLPKVGHTVRHKKKKKVTGEVVKVNKKTGVCLVDIGKSKPVAFDFDEVVQVEDEDEDDDFDFDDEDEDEKPKKKKKKKK